MNLLQKVTHFFILLLLLTFNFTNAQSSGILKNGTRIYFENTSKIDLQNLLKYFAPVNYQSTTLSSDWQIDSLLAFNTQEPVYKSVFSYEDGKVIANETFLNSSSGWVKSELQINEYDENENRVSNVLKDWVGDSWKDYARTIYEYNDSGDIISSLMQLFNDSEWVNQHQSLSDYYDSNHKETLGQFYSNGKWENDSFLKDYDSRGEFYEKSVFQLWNDNENDWENFVQVTREFNDNDQLMSILSQVWLNDKWQGNLFIEYINNEFEQIAYTNHYEFTESGWDLVSRQLYNYDGNNNLTEIVSEELLNGEWVPGTYPIVVNFSNDYSLGYNGFYKVKVYQSNITDIKNNSNLSKEFTLSQNYPNPFNPSTIIKFSIPNVETTRRVVSTKLTVYDVLGREVKTLINKYLSPGNYKVEFNGGNLTSGVYFYVLEAGQKRLCKKMLLIK